MIRSQRTFGCLVVGLSFIAPAAHGAEPTESMRAHARAFVALEARDLNRYCSSKLGAPYGEYLTRACNSAVLNRLKTVQDCAPEKISQQARSDASQCLAMLPAEFERTVLVGEEARILFLKQLQVQGIDGEDLMRGEVASRR